MAYVAPTLSDFKARFPAFGALGDLNDEAVQFALDDAASSTDDTWPEASRFQAVMLLAAHGLTLNGVGSGAEAEMARAGALGFQRLKSGSLELDRGSAAASSSDGSDLDQTGYGRRFRAMVRRNFPPILVV